MIVVTSYHEQKSRLSLSPCVRQSHRFTPELLLCCCLHRGGQEKMTKGNDNMNRSHIEPRTCKVTAKQLLRRRSVWTLFQTAPSLQWNQLKLTLFITNWLKLSAFCVQNSIFGEWICEMRHYFYSHLMRKRHLAPWEKRFNQSNALPFIYSYTFTINILLIARLSSLLHTPCEKNPCCEIHRIRLYFHSPDCLLTLGRIDLLWGSYLALAAPGVMRSLTNSTHSFLEGEKDRKEGLTLQS